MTSSARCWNAAQNVSTATLTTVPAEGLRNVWLRGARPLKLPACHRLVGQLCAFCSDPRRSGDTGVLGRADFHHTAVEAMEAGSVAVIDDAQVTDAGVFTGVSCVRAWPCAALMNCDRRRRA